MSDALRNTLLGVSALLTLHQVSKSFAQSLRRNSGQHYRLGSGSEFDAFTARYGGWLFGAGVVLALADHSRATPAFPGPLRDLATAGFLASCCLLVWTDRCLAHHFDHYREEDPALMTTGPYARLRHPRYACWILLLAGWTLALGSALGLLAVAAFVFPVIRRIRLEERFLFEVYGERYARYAQRSARLLPGVW